MNVECFALHLLRVKPAAVMHDDGSRTNGIRYDGACKNGAAEARDPDHVARCNVAQRRIRRVDEADFPAGNLGLPEGNGIELAVKPCIAFGRYELEVPAFRILERRGVRRVLSVSVGLVGLQIGRVRRAVGVAEAGDSF